jgi:hypothetical protein
VTSLDQHQRQLTRVWLSMPHRKFLTGVPWTNISWNSRVETPPYAGLIRSPVDTIVPAPRVRCMRRYIVTQ